MPFAGKGRNQLLGLTSEMTLCFRCRKRDVPENGERWICRACKFLNFAGEGGVKWSSSFLSICFETHVKSLNKLWPLFGDGDEI